MTDEMDTANDVTEVDDTHIAGPLVTDDEEVETAEEVTPGWVTEGTADDEAVLDEGGEDVSEAKPMERSEVIDAAKGVTFVITNALPERNIPKKEYGPNNLTGYKDDPKTGEPAWRTASLALWLQIDKGGTDGKGKNKGRMFFPRSPGANGIIVAVNRNVYDFSINSQGKPTTWYAPKVGGAFGEYNQILAALGFDPKKTPKNDAAFRKSLIGRKIVADITKDRAEIYDEAKGKSVKSKDEWVNNLQGYRAVKAGGTTASATTQAPSGGQGNIAEVAEG